MISAGPVPGSDQVAVDVITVNYRSAADVRRLAADLAGLTRHGVTHHLLVVDCSGEMVDNDDGGADLVVIDPGGNVGFGPASNLGLQHVRAPLTAFVNPDCRLDVAAFASLVRAGLAEGAVAWTGVLRNEDGSVQRNTAPAFVLRRLALEYLAGVDTSFPGSAHRREVRTISGALIVVQAADLRAIGGFDPTYPLYVEDVDLTDRLAARGPVVQYPIELGVHVGGRSSRHARPATTTLLHASRIHWFARQGRVSGMLARVIVLLGCLLRWLAQPAERSALRPLDVWRAGRPTFVLAELLPAGRPSS